MVHEIIHVSTLLSLLTTILTSLLLPHQLTFFRMFSIVQVDMLVDSYQHFRETFVSLFKGQNKRFLQNTGACLQKHACRILEDSLQTQCPKTLSLYQGYCLHGLFKN